MLRITIELVSANGEARDRLLGVAHVWNTGDVNALGQARYEYTLSKTLPGQTEAVWRRGRAALVQDTAITDHVAGTITGFDNVRRGAWDLLYRVLHVAVGARNR